MEHSSEPKLLLDFGNVVTHDRDAPAFDPLLARLGLDRDSFHAAWGRRRPGYDAGSLDSRAYWNLVLQDVSMDMPEDAKVRSDNPRLLSELMDTDFRSFLHPREGIRALMEELADRGVPMGILSNMPAGMGPRWIHAWPWLGRVDIAVWSGDEGLSKPDPAIYRLFLERSGWVPGQTLFVDDVQANIDAAAQLGFATHLFVDEAAAIGAIRSWLATGPATSRAPAR